MKKICCFVLLVIIAVSVFPQGKNVKKERKAKYIFYFIGDGMGINHVIGTEMYLAELEGQVGVRPLSFTQFPVVNFATTYSRYNSVTCSAAAGTALATGEKTKNGTIGMDSLQQVSIYSVAAKAKKAGMKVGITTTVGVNHATPAAFYAHRPNRNMYYEIGTDLPKSGFDFYAGSGILTSVSIKNPELPNLLTIFRDSGYVIARGLVDFKNKVTNARKVILIQEEGCDSSRLPYAIDRLPTDLTLSQITGNAIEFLNRNNKKGFFLMIEGGLIDWACHQNDVGTVFREVVDFSDAIEQAYRFYMKHPDETLIVVTADHETGGMSLGTGRYALNLSALQHQSCSKEVLSLKINRLRSEKPEATWEDVRNLLSEEMGFWTKIELDMIYENRLKAVYQRSFGTKKNETVKSLYAEDELLAATAISILDEIAMISWGFGGHSAGAVPVYAIGVGAGLFTGSLDNIDIPKKIIEAGGY